MKVVEIYKYQPHLTIIDKVDESVHVLPVALVESISKGMNLEHLDDEEKHLTIRLFATALLDYIE